MSFQPGLGFGIEHVVVLMLENRSFDNIFGNLYPYHQKIGDNEFEGLPPGAANKDSNGKSYSAWTETPPYTDATLATIPTPDPGERFQNVNYQLYGTGFDPSTTFAELCKEYGPAPMSGFVTDYLLPGPTTWIGSDPWPHLPWPALPREGATAEHIMHYFSPDLTPVSSAFAKQYAVCDMWFSAVATQTFANRMWAHAGSSDGGTDNVEIFEKHFIEGYKLNNIFQVLDDSKQNLTWRIYYDKGNDSYSSYSISELLFHYVKQHTTNLSDISNFSSDVKSGLPNYTFIEPNYGYRILPTPSRDPVNSYHPPFNVLDGERFLWQIYHTLQTQNPTEWQKTLFLVTFDEHGGCYDHFSPPGVPAPPGESVAAAPFDRYGVRVPTMIISPNVAPGTLFRAQSANGQYLDHTSILRTVFDCFLGTDVSITPRDLNAPSFAGAMMQNTNNPGISACPPFPVIPPLSKEQLDRIHAAPNHLVQIRDAASKSPSDE